MIITFAVSCNIFHNIEHQTVVTVSSGFYFENITRVETTYSGGGVTTGRLAFTHWFWL